MRNALRGNRGAEHSGWRKNSRNLKGSLLDQAFRAGLTSRLVHLLLAPNASSQAQLLEMSATSTDGSNAELEFLLITI